MAGGQDVLQQCRGPAPPGGHPFGEDPPADGGNLRVHPQKPLPLPPPLQTAGPPLPLPSSHQRVSRTISLAGPAAYTSTLR